MYPHSHVLPPMAEWHAETKKSLAMLHAPPQCPKTSPDDIISCLGEDAARPSLDAYDISPMF